MLTQSDKDNILSKFPNIKLSYENIAHKIVYDSDLIFIIPEGKKCFIWFTKYNNKNVCFLMELTYNKNIVDIQIINTSFSDDLFSGTIIYGTLSNYLNQSIFFIEDIFSYKSVEFKFTNWGEKMIKIHDLLKNNLKQNNSFIFGVPVFCKKIQDVENEIKGIKYKIAYLQFKSFYKYNFFLYMKYDYYNKIKLHNNNKNNDYKNNDYKNNDKYKKNNTQNNTQINKKNNSSKVIIFEIKPSIQNDIYFLFYLNDEGKEEYYNIAYIPNYITSVMMNRLFRIIKENNNLDALEESDDEEEFENEKEDKFVYLNKSYKMICKYNHKFKKWYPIKLVNNESKIITKTELDNMNLKNTY